MAELTGTLISHITSFEGSLGNKATWGLINGDISDQEDLQSALNLKAESSDLTDHVSDTNNPHEVTKAQLGLGNVDNTSDINKPISSATQVALNGKVSDVKVNGQSVVEGGVANVKVPTLTSDLTNDSGFITEADFPHNVKDGNNNSIHQINATSIGDNSVAYGTSISGSKAFSVSQLKSDKKTFVFVSTTGIEVGMQGNLYIYDGSIDTNIMLFGIVESINGNEVTFNNTVSWSGGLSLQNSYIWFTNHPELGNVIIGSGAVAEGYNTNATQVGSHSEGINTVALGKYSHAEGNGSVAGGYCSHAEGRNTKTTGLYAHSGGDGSEASGDYSFAHGLTNKATNRCASAFNERTQANGGASSAFGYNCEANGTTSFVGGTNSKANHDSSFAFGTRTKTSRNNQVVFGRDNQDNSDALFIIGDGANENSKHNAFEVLANDVKSNGISLERKSNKVTSIDSESTDIQYPSAKCVYDEISPLETAISNLSVNKVDKVSGKGLSTNDFTNADKSKLDGIESGAEVNVIEDIKVDNISLTPTNKSVNIDLSGKENISNKTTSLSSASTNTQYPSAKCVYGLLSGKQDTLASGTNIKTINNISLLGSGNIDIQGGSGTVDEHYSPTSNNAQSGKAVAEALNTVVPDTYNSLYNETVFFKRNSVAREDRYYLAYPPLNGITLEITNKSNINIQVIGYVGTRLIEYTSAFIVNKTIKITIQDDLTQFGFRCLAAGNLNVLINGEEKATQNKRNQELYQAMYDNDITYLEQATTTSGEYIYFEYPPAVGTTLRFTNLSEKQVRIYGYAKANNAEVLITSWLGPDTSETTTITTELRAMAVRAGNGTQGIKVEIAGSNALSSIPLNNKKVMYFGDSITEDPARYRRNLNLYTGMVEVASYAVSGATLKNTNSTVMDGNPSQGNNNTVPNQVQKLLNLETKPEAPDIVIVSAGTNDTVTLSETFSEAQYTDGAAAYPTFTDVSNCDLTTWSGAIRWIYEKIISVYPNAVIFFATPIQSVKVSYELMKHKRDLIVENCNRLSTPVIDAFNLSGIYARYEINGEDGKYLIDGLHPNTSGAIKLAECYQIELLKEQYII